MRRQHLVERARRHRLADRELHQPVEPVVHVRHRRHRAAPDRRSGGTRSASRAARRDPWSASPARSSRAPADAGRALDLDLAADRPERVPARRQPLDELALDDRAGPPRGSRPRARPRSVLRVARDHRQMARRHASGRCATSMRSTSTAVATFQNTRVCHGPIRCIGRPSRLTMATSSALVSTASNSSRREIRPRRLEHGVALGRELGAHDLEAARPSARAADRTACGGPARAPARTGRCASGRRARHPSRSRAASASAGSWHVSFVGRADRSRGR